MNSSDIIPFDFQIKMLLSRVDGTLLYAIDAKDNQLILSLQSGIQNRLEVEFRHQKNYFSLQELCGCGRCKYRWLSLTVRIGKTILIKCNQNEWQNFDFPKEKILNKGYPVLRKSDNEKMVVYLINTPLQGNVYPNNIQLQGCIKDVLFNGKSANLTISGQGIKEKCESVCVNNICNDGECLETFSEEPICDCNNTFLNGKYCKSNPSMLNRDITIENLTRRQFKHIKLTWKSKSHKIFDFFNKKFKFSIEAGDGLSISLLYEGYQWSQVITGKFLNYDKSSISMLIISFNHKSINIRLNTSLANVTGEMAVPININEESFTSLNGYGIIDLVYKNSPLEYTWNDALSNVYFTTKRPLNTTTQSILEDEPKKPKLNWKYYIILVEIFAILISIIQIIVLVLRKKFKRKSRKDKMEIVQNKEDEKMAIN